MQMQMRLNQWILLASQWCCKSVAHTQGTQQCLLRCMALYLARIATRVKKVKPLAR